MIKRISCILLACALLLSASALLISCEKEDTSGAKLLSFSQAQSIDEIEKMNGEKVTIIGYMSTLSPVSGSVLKEKE